MIVFPKNNSIMVIGKIINKMDSEFTYGSNLEEKANSLEIDTKVNGLTGRGMALVFFTMQMDQSIWENLK